MELVLKIPLVAFTLLTLVCCASGVENRAEKITMDPVLASKLDTAIFASGCFWCTEAVFERVKGVEAVVSGYSGGTKPNPTYQEVSAGRTNYAEAVKVFYDPEVISYEELVEMFFASHNPTQLNRQGPDVGKQYRSAIFYRNTREKEIAEKVMSKLNKSGKYDKTIVTEITAFANFYDAEDYHQDYYELNPNQSYVVAVSKPKVEKFMKEYNDKLKNEYRR